MSGPTRFLGIDGGGTKTEFVMVNWEGEIVAQALGPTSYHLQVGLAGVETVLRRGLDTICNQAGIRPEEIGFAFFGLPAFGEDKAVDPELIRLCGALLGHDRFRCDNDMVCGWAGSLGCQDGINLVAGTGSIGYGERNGRTARIGGWGELFSDEGSAYWIALRGLNAFTRMSDGRLHQGPLHGILAERLALEDDIDICARVMGGDGMTRDEIAALAMCVSEGASAGDEIAATILDDAASELAAIAVSLRRTLGFLDSENTAISWSGGVLTRMVSVRSRFERRLNDIGGFASSPPRYFPGHGAALYAKHLHSANCEKPLK